MRVYQRRVDNKIPTGCKEALCNKAITNGRISCHLGDTMVTSKVEKGFDVREPYAQADILKVFYDAAFRPSNMVPIPTLPTALLIGGIPLFSSGLEHALFHTNWLADVHASPRKMKHHLLKMWLYGTSTLVNEKFISSRCTTHVVFPTVELSLCHWIGASWISISKKVACQWIRVSHFMKSAKMPLGNGPLNVQLINNQRRHVK